VNCLGIIHHLIHVDSDMGFYEIVNRIDKICNRFLLIEWVPTGSYGPYANKPYITKSTFCAAFRSKFSEFYSVGYTTKYDETVIPRHLTKEDRGLMQSVDIHEHVMGKLRPYT
jgi:hypothetical protein